MDSNLKFFFDRIYRINRIFSRFPDETAKSASAEAGNSTTLILWIGRVGTKISG
jgi:hypothetical protein